MQTTAPWTMSAIAHRHHALADHALAHHGLMVAHVPLCTHATHTTAETTAHTHPPVHSTVPMHGAGRPPIRTAPHVVYVVC